MERVSRSMKMVRSSNLLPAAYRSRPRPLGLPISLSKLRRRITRARAVAAPTLGLDAAVRRENSRSFKKWILFCQGKNLGQWKFLWAMPFGVQR